MSEVLVTGSNGIIGTVLSRGLEQTVRAFDLPEHDARKYADVLDTMRGCDAAIHLAWDTLTDNYKSQRTNPENYGMAQNVYLAARTLGVGRVIMASSVHADMPVSTAKRSAYALPEPDSPYGATKVAIESLGRYYSQKGLAVICIRFGWVSSSPENRPTEGTGYPHNEGWLSHRDCRSLIAACLLAPHVPNNYQILWGVSKRHNGIHNLSNPFAWEPQDSYTAS